MTRFLDINVPIWFAPTPPTCAEVGRVPGLRHRPGARGGARCSPGWASASGCGAPFRTEFFIKTGLVLLGASINLDVIVSAAGPAILQAVS